MQRNVKTKLIQHTATRGLRRLTAGVDIVSARAGTALLSTTAFTGRTLTSRPRRSAIPSSFASSRDWRTTKG